jgi:putative transposase
MSTTCSPATGRAYGLQRVCRVWEKPRSSVYARRERSQASAAAPRRRGPKPALSDAELLEAIRRDLERSPWQNEGHRKVFGRLRILDGIRTSRTRVLRVMREHRLLSPHRGRCAVPRTHEGTITTDAPSLMWGTDGVRVFTVRDGWVWIFCAVEHWNAECVGWHVCKRGDRFAALEPVAQGVLALYGSLEAGVARGLALRMDHGTQYLSDHFVAQIRYWGLAPSYAFVEQPQTNGVAERFNRTLKEQAIHGRIFEDLAAVRAAVGAFVEQYNRHWRLEKLGFQTPWEAREHHRLRAAA